MEPAAGNNSGGAIGYLQQHLQGMGILLMNLDCLMTSLEWPENGDVSQRSIQLSETLKGFLRDNAANPGISELEAFLSDHGWTGTQFQSEAQWHGLPSAVRQLTRNTRVRSTGLTQRSVLRTHGCTCHSALLQQESRFPKRQKSILTCSLTRDVCEYPLHLHYML